MKTGSGRRLRILGLIATLALGSALTLRAQVLVIYSAYNAAYGTDVVNKISAAAPSLGTVTLHNAAYGGAPLPTLSELSNYKAVFVFTDSPGFASDSNLGNLLADYVDAGGGVVDTMFANGSFPITGRWQSGGYSAIYSTSTTTGTNLTLGTIAVPTSPIMNGVDSLSVPRAFYANTSVRAGATLIASWSNGAPLVAVSNGFNGQVVTLNFYPPSSTARSDFWNAATDGAQLMANSLLYVAVPEPSTYALLALGLGAVLWARRRR